MRAIQPAEISDFADAIGRTLVHSLWQGAVVAGVLCLVLIFIRKRKAGVRYGVSWLSLQVLLSWSLLTLSEEISGGSGALSPAEANSAGEILSGTNDGIRGIPGYGFFTTGRTVNLILASGWCFGASFFLIRLAAGWRRLHQLRQSARPVADVSICRLFTRTRASLGIREKVALLASDRVSGPMLSGFFKPAVLIPAALLSGVPAAYLQSIFAHELAHFRRWDYVLNLVQCLVEALFFYHPAVWWISRQTRIEREHCCDDLALAVHGNGLRQYAGTLAWLEQFRSDDSRSAPFGPALAMQRNRSETLSRLERLVALRKGSTQPCRVRHSTGFSGIGTMLALGLAVFLLNGPPAGILAGEIPAEAVNPEKREEEVFVRCREGIALMERCLEIVDRTDPFWPRRSVESRQIPLFRSILVVEKNGQLFCPTKENPRIFPELPNAWLVEHRLNILDELLPYRDPDGDGFTNLEEFRGDTNPNEAADHPAPIGKLQFIGRHVQIYRIEFAARPDERHFQLNRHPTALFERQTEILELGETTADGKLRLERMTPEGLAVTFLDDGSEHQLEKGSPEDISTWFAELKLNFAGEVPFFVKAGEAFQLPGDSAQEYRLSKVDESGAEITGVETGGVWALGKLED